MSDQARAMRITPEWLNEHNTRFVDRPDGIPGLMGVIYPYVVLVEGNNVGVIDTRISDTEFVSLEKNIRSYGQPFYDSVESFLRWCGDEARVGYLELEEIGVIMYLYDHRPSKELVQYPDGTEIPLDDRGYFEGDNFAYGMNLAYPYMSEWGYASYFPLNGEDDNDRVKRQKADVDQMAEVFGHEREPMFIIDSGISVTGRSAAAQ